MDKLQKINTNNLLKEEEYEYTNDKLENYSRNELITYFKSYIQNRFNLNDNELPYYVNDFNQYLNKLQKIENDDNLPTNEYIVVMLNKLQIKEHTKCIIYYYLLDKFIEQLDENITIFMRKYNEQVDIGRHYQLLYHNISDKLPNITLYSPKLLIDLINEIEKNTGLIKQII